MRCPRCQHENAAEQKFCGECGAPLAGACARCGASNPPGQKFCGQCGNALTPAPAQVKPAPAETYTPRHLAEKILTSKTALEGERKQVTVLFADCAGFTALSTKLDPEELHAVMDGCFMQLSETVHRYEGTINQFTGDGIMALFGAPIAHEDHAVRGVAAALAIQRAAREYEDVVRRERGLDFSLRIGINTGPVVVGKIGDDLRMDYTAQGQTVNLAARLQAAAPLGGVLISESTQRLVDGYFLLQDHGELTLKGFEHAVRAFAVTDQRRRRARFDIALERGLTPLVGRGAERQFLLECVARSRAGRGQVVSVVGEAGLGKSRLAYELQHELRDEALLYLEAHCAPHGAALPFHPIVQLVQAIFRIEEGEAEATQREKLLVGLGALDPSLDWAAPYLGHLLALPAPELEAQGLDQAQRKWRLIEAVKAVVLRAAQQRPLVVVVEDLQWIDRHSEEVMRALADSLGPHRVLLLCSYRPGYGCPWQDRSYHHRLTLAPLSDAEAADMAAALLGAGDVPPAVQGLLVRRAEGNPFFVEELARYLREQGPDAHDLPETVQDLLTARLDRLPEGLKQTLQTAAVLGREFSLALLEAVAARSAELRADLRELVRLELLHETDLFPELKYRFTHTLVQEAAYQELLLRSRAELHARAGAALERLYADRLEEVLPTLAEHYARSDERAKALHYLVRAGDRAASLFAYDEAGDYYRRALEILERDADSGEQRAVVLERIGDAAFAHGELPSARAGWGQALTLVSADPARAADLHRKIGGAAWAAGEKDAALAHLEEGLQVLGDDLQQLAAARLYQEFGRIHFRLGDHDRAMQWAQRALALGEQLGAQDVVSHAYNTLGVATARAGNLEAGAEHVKRSLETALGQQLGAVAARAYTNLAVMYASLDHDRSAAYCREGLALAEKIGDRLQQSWLYCTLASGHCTLTGDYDEGVKAAEAAIEADERLGQRSHLPIPLIILAQIYQCRGGDDQAAHFYRRALAVAEEVGEPQLLFPCYEGLATLAIERGEDAEAERLLARSREVQQATGWSSDTFLVLPFLC
jgi:predicted ATPase/class 3 adenylate cyclase